MDPLTPWISLASALSAVALSQYWTDKREQRKERESRKQAFLNKQLDEFYGPLSGLLSGVIIRKRTYDNAIMNAAKRGQEALDAKNRDAAERYKKLVETLKKQAHKHYREIDMQAVKDMIKLFESKPGLSERSTLRHLPELQSLLAIWEIILAEGTEADLIEPHVREDKIFDLFGQDLKSHSERLLAQVRVEPSRESLTSAPAPPLLPEDPSPNAR